MCPNPQEQRNLPRFQKLMAAGRFTAARDNMTGDLLAVREGAE